MQMTRQILESKTRYCRIHGVWAKAMPFFAAFVATAGAWATPTVTINKVAQRWPWNNKVDVTYTIGDGQDVANERYYRLVFTTVIDDTVTNIVDGVHDVGANTSNGTHTVTWTAPSGYKTDNFKVSAALYTATVPSGDDYMIVNLETGAVTYEGLYATQEDSNTRYNTEANKSDYLVLRKVPAGGTYQTGHGNYATYNNVKSWTTDRDYYIGIFPVTQAQYVKLGLANPARTKDSLYRPVERVSWNDLRGEVKPTDAIQNVSAPGTGTFFQRLNYITGNRLGFDLPTEVMSEIAERAGTTTMFYWGDTVTDDSSSDFYYDKFIVCSENRLVDTTVPVGSRLPNAWGLYDVLGYVMEWCLDDTSRSSLPDAPDPWTPACSDGNSRRMLSNDGRLTLRWSVGFKISYRNYDADLVTIKPSEECSNSTDWGIGFRVARIVK